MQNVTTSLLFSLSQLSMGGPGCIVLAEFLMLSSICFEKESSLTGRRLLRICLLRGFTSYLADGGGTPFAWLGKNRGLQGHRVFDQDAVPGTDARARRDR